MDLDATFTSTSIFEIKDVPLTEVELQNLIGFAVTARDNGIQEPEAEKEEVSSIILPT